MLPAAVCLGRRPYDKPVPLHRHGARVSKTALLLYCLLPGVQHVADHSAEAATILQAYLPFERRSATLLSGLQRQSSPHQDATPL